MNEAERFLESRRTQAETAQQVDIVSNEPNSPHRYIQTSESNKKTMPGWFSIQGRIGRKTYFLRMFIIFAAYFALIWLIAFWYGTTLVMALPSGTDMTSIIEAAGTQIALLVGFLSLPFVIMQDTKRLHDLNMSGWNQLCFLIPLFGWLFRLYVFVRRGTSGPNNYGHNPV